MPASSPACYSWPNTRCESDAAANPSQDRAALRLASEVREYLACHAPIRGPTATTIHSRAAPSS
jgi:hypothetical protein